MKRHLRLAFGLLGGAAIAIAAGLAVVAQPAGNQSSGAASTSPDQEGPPGVPVIQAPPEAAPPDNTPVEADGGGKRAATNSVSAKPAPPPPEALRPAPVRSPVAVLQALDKITAETMRFAAPVGQPVRYKNLVFIVKACESTGLGGPSPQESAYVVIDFAPVASEGIAPPPARQVYKGWMFASSPGLNPLQNPTYDAWLITCMAAPPPA